MLSEILKAHAHGGAMPDVTFFRDHHGLQADAVVQVGRRTLLVEAKSGETVPSDTLASLDKVQDLLKSAGMPARTSKLVVHRGRERWTQRETTALP